MYYRGYDLMVRGDPGFFGNLFHAVTGVVGGAVKGFIKGGPVGAIIGAGTGAISATASNIGSATLEAGGSQSALTPQLRAQHAAALARGTPAIHAAAAHRMLGAGGGGGGRRRRMNWANGKAMSRAERRIASFVKHATRYVRWVHPSKHGHLVPKFTRRKK
jgi:hypothetical protein